MKLNCYGKTYDVRLQKDKYVTNQNLAITVFEKGNDGYPFAVLTVNTDLSLPDNQAFVDINNCEWATKFIEENEIGTFKGIYSKSGFVNYPLYEFDMDKISV